MVRAFLSTALGEARGLHKAAYILAGFALGSQLLALVRDRLLAATFGAGQTLDVYYAAFRVPDLLFATVASLLSLYALLPILSRYSTEDAGKMISFLRGTLLVFFVGMGAICGVLYFFLPYLVPLVAPGITDAVAQENLLLLAQILLLQPILLGASNIVASFTQLKHRFFLYSISPLLYNLGIIVGVIALYPLFGIAGLGWGVVLGAFLHLLVQIPFFLLHGSQPLALSSIWKPLGEVLKLSIPRTLALAAGQISLLVLIAMASLYAEGSIAIFMFAWNLQAVPLTIIGVSYSVAAFPTLARLHALGSKYEFINHIESALRHILFWSIPAMVLLVVLRAQIVRVILGSGAFDWEATRLTAAALALFALSLCAQGMVLLIARAYYAAGKTAVPLILGVIAVSVTVVTAVVLVFLFRLSELAQLFLENLLRVTNIGDTTILMLALAYTIGALVQGIVGLMYLKKDFHVAYRGLLRLFFQSGSAAVVGGVAAYGVLTIMGSVVDINTLIGILLQGVLAGIVGLLATALMLLFLKNQEILEAYASFKRRLIEAPQVTIESTDVSS
jgi:putative peptidoglycan lipid II flippase